MPHKVKAFTVVEKTGNRGEEEGEEEIGGREGVDMGICKLKQNLRSCRVMTLDFFCFIYARLKNYVFS